MKRFLRCLCHQAFGKRKGITLLVFTVAFAGGGLFVTNRISVTGSGNHPLPPRCTPHIPSDPSPIDEFRDNFPGTETCDIYKQDSEVRSGSSVAEDESGAVSQDPRRLLAGGLLWEALRAEVTATDEDMPHRRMMLRLLAFKSKAVLRDTAAVASDRSEAEHTIEILFGIVEDRSEAALLRAEAASGLASLMQIQREQGAIGDAQRSRIGDAFLAVLDDDTEEEHVRGRAVKVLRAVDDRRAVPIMRRFIVSNRSVPAFVMRCAVTSLAKMGERSAIPDIVGRVSRTEDPEEFATIMYALCLFRDASLLRPLLAHAGRFDPQISRNLLWYNQAIVSSALRSPDPVRRQDGIEAMVLSDLRPLKSDLLALLRDPHAGVRERARNAALRMGYGEAVTTETNGVSQDSKPVLSAGVADVPRQGKDSSFAPSCPEDSL